MSSVPSRPGICETTLIAAGIRYCDYPEPASIEIPYWTRDGEITKFKRWRLPSVRDNGQKYHQESGTGVYAFFPPGFFRRNGAESKFGLPVNSVVLVEGEFKALALMELGVYAIGLPSFNVYLRDENQHRGLIRDLQVTFSKEKIQTIYFLGDADTATNFEFSRQAAFLASAAFPAQVFLPRIPINYPKGIDDCKDKLGADFDVFFRDLIQNAIKLPQKCDPTEVALLILEPECERIKTLGRVQQQRHFRRIVKTVGAAQVFGETDATALLRKIASKVIGITTTELKTAIKTEQSKRNEESKQDTTKKSPESDSRPDLILPGHRVEFRECGHNAFPTLAKTERYFVRDRTVFELVKSSSGARLVELKPEAFRSQLEEYFHLRSWVKVNRKLVLLESRCSVADATALLKSDPAWQLLPPLQLLTAAPVFIANNGQPEILHKGYHPIMGGIYVSRDYDIVEVPLPEAINAIKALGEDFLFVAESDKSRFLAGFLAPALRFGDLIKADFPLFINEADKSQTGKTYAHKVLCQLYNERPFTVTLNNEHNSPGSHDEKLSKGMIEGHPFIMWENVRELLGSQLAESAIRGTGSVICRIAYTPPIAVETHKFIWLLSSNKASVTPDLAVRALITRMRKQPDSHKFHEFEDGRDLLKQVQHNCPYYLSCILSIIRAWFSQGCPHSNDRRHDSREACQTLDWIIQNFFELPPLLDDHPTEQTRVANPLLNCLRDVALLVEKNLKLQEWLRSSEIAALCADHGLPIPQCRDDADETTRNQTVGRLLTILFTNAPNLSVSGFRVNRQTIEEYDPRRQKNMNITRHYFDK